MFKKLLSFVVLITFMLNTASYALAVTTNNSATPWNKEKARHLANKALFGATPKIVDDLEKAGSASAAFDLLFPTSEPDRTAFQAELDALVAEDGFNPESRTHMDRFYVLKRYRDPYEAKAKLALIFQDIFSVNQSSEIRFKDVEDLHNLLYGESLGNYQEMVRAVLYNDGQTGDYAAGAFLDLYNLNKNRPNENYARELLQLFLMLEYKPWESKDVEGAVRNYSETDVEAAALMLTGFTFDETTHAVSFDASNHNRTPDLTLLPGTPVSGYTRPFYDGDNDTVNLELMEVPFNGNNGLPDNAIDYIFAKRGDEISYFVADRLFRFYVHEKPTQNDIEWLAGVLRSNSFDIKPTLKTLLTDDRMYSDESMNALLFKNPLETFIGTFKKLHQENPTNLDSTYRETWILNSIGYANYYPGSIFGRDGYDDNKNWNNSYFQNRWANVADYLIYNNNAGNFDTPTFLGDVSSVDTPDKLLDLLEEKLFLGYSMDSNARGILLEYLTKDNAGADVAFDLSDSTYLHNKVKGAIFLMLVSPEYMLISGHDRPSVDDNTAGSFFEDDTPSIVFVELFGGYDWLNGIVPKAEYNEYLDRRGVIAKQSGDLLSLNDDFFIGKQIEPFKTVYDSGDLIAINRVGAPHHSRAHDAAQKQMTSLKNKQSNDGAVGIFGHLIKDEPKYINTIVVGGNKPNVYRKGHYVNISGSDSSINVGGPSGTDNIELLGKKFNDITLNRTYPGDIENVFTSAIEISNASKSGISFRNMSGKLEFVENSMDNNIGKAYYVSDGGYDTHRGQNRGNGAYDLDKRTEDLSTAIVDFYNRVKGKKDVTIIVYSEFGRTMYVNGSDGTDHGKGGGYFILSNNAKLKSEFPEKIYGNISITKEPFNRLTSGIDYRSVYTKIYKALYDIDFDIVAGYKNPDEIGVTFKFEDYLDSALPKIVKVSNEFSTINDTLLNQSIKFHIEDKNYDRFEASYMTLEYGSDEQRSSKYEPKKLLRYTNYNENGEISINLRNLTHDRDYFYKLSLTDNQFNTYEYEFKLKTPKIDRSTSNFTIDLGAGDIYSDTIFRQKQGIMVDGEVMQDINFGSGEAEHSYGDIKMKVSDGTKITKLTSNESVRYNGTFVTPRFKGNEFVSSDANFKGVNLSDLKIEKIIKVGADNYGVGMTLNNPVELSFSGLDPNKNYSIITSEDGINWDYQNMENSVVLTEDGEFKFSTDHFSEFAIYETPDPTKTKFISCDIKTSKDKSLLGGKVELSWNSTGATSAKIARISIEEFIMGGTDSKTDLGDVVFSGKNSIIIPETGTGYVYLLELSNETTSRVCNVRIDAIKEEFDVPSEPENPEENTDNTEMIREDVTAEKAFEKFTKKDGQIKKRKAPAKLMQDINQGKIINTDSEDVAEIILTNDSNLYYKDALPKFKKKALRGVNSERIGTKRFTFSKSVSIGSDDTVILDKPATIKLLNVDPKANKYAFRQNESTVWTYKDIQNSSCTPVFPEDCAYRDGNDVVILTYHFTDFAAVAEEEIRSSSSRGGGSVARKDYCPNGDFSRSYYDYKCYDDTPDPKEDTKTEKDKIAMVGNKEQDLIVGEEKEVKKGGIKGGNYKGHTIIYINGREKLNRKVEKVFDYIISKNFSYEDEEMVISSLNSVIISYNSYRYGNLDKVSSGNKLKRQMKLFSISYKKAVKNKKKASF